VLVSVIEIFDLFMIMVMGREGGFQFSGKGAVDGGIGYDVVGQDGHGVAGGIRQWR
jgi:hypothetical protein